MASYQIKVVDRAGTVLATLAGASKLAPIKRELNRAGSFGFTLGNLDAQALSVLPIQREVQVFRDAVLLDQGWFAITDYASTLSAEIDEVRFDCAGLEWYLDRRNFGRADRRNFLINADFEDASLAPWAVNNTTATQDTSRRKLGAKSAKLVQSTAGQVAAIDQPVTITAGTVGELVTVAAWFYLDPATWVGPAIDGKGLELRRVSLGGDVLEVAMVEITDETPRGAWQRIEASVHMPPSAVEGIQVILFSPGGTIWWEALSLTLMESLSSYGLDQTAIAARIVEHAQDTAIGKSNLAIGTSTSATGVIRDRHYQYAEHLGIGEALAEFATLDNGFDAAIAVSTTARLYTTYFPRKGVARAPLPLTDMVSCILRFDGAAAANSITVLGDGDGPDREEGGAVDAAALGGVTLEDVVAAPTGTDIDALDSKATEMLRIRKVARTLEVKMKPGLRINELVPGDTLTVTAQHGYMDATGVTWRVMETTLDTATDSLSFVANVA